MTPISLHPDNGHYFLFRGKPAVLISSAEHYGAVLNLDFDFVPYLKELEARRLNQTRAFSGAYREMAGSFNITRNTLAPQPDRFCAPWPRSETPGAADGLAKFDLSRWNETYFRRLQDYCREAGRRGVVIELVLFCPFYKEEMWAVSPMNARNNTGGVGDVASTDVYTLRDRPLTAVQEALTRRLVEATADFDNVYYEICNEPYFGGVTMEWQRRIADVITAAQRNLPAKHLIAQNIANGSARIEKPHPDVSVFNFHYANPPDAVAANYALNKVIAFDETGFKGVETTVYRTDAWEFLLAGGGLYSHLDYSFTASHETGTFAFPPNTPGSGGPALRAQLGVLHDFMNALPLVRLRPDNALIGDGLPPGMTARALSEPGKTCAVYLKGGPATRLPLALPAGRYQAVWTLPGTGATERTDRITHPGGSATLAVPPYTEDLALRLTRQASRR